MDNKMEEWVECLYCGESKKSTEMTLEHAIPQFMGGAFAPDCYELKNVCKKCNNNLGLFVDAAYAKNALVSGALDGAVFRFKGTSANSSLPLRCIGKTEIDGLEKPENYVSEYWIGPSGESIIWVRHEDTRMQSYVGGNPIDRNKKDSTMYYFPVGTDYEEMLLGLRSFEKALSKFKKIRKIICAELIDAIGARVNPDFLGFDVPNEKEIGNWKVIKGCLFSKPAIKMRTLINIRFDMRFICKLTLGVGYSLFREKFYNEIPRLRKGIWPERDDENIDVKGRSTMNMKGNEQHAKIFSYPGAVSIALLHLDSSWSMITSIDEKIPFIVELSSKSLVVDKIDKEDPYIILLFPNLKTVVELTLSELLFHRQGKMINGELAKIDALMTEESKFDINSLLSQ